MRVIVPEVDGPAEKIAFAFSLVAILPNQRGTAFL